MYVFVLYISRDVAKIHVSFYFLNMLKSKEWMAHDVKSASYLRRSRRRLYDVLGCFHAAYSCKLGFKYVRCGVPLFVRLIHKHHNSCF